MQTTNQKATPATAAVALLQQVRQEVIEATSKVIPERSKIVKRLTQAIRLLHGLEEGHRE